MKLASINSTIKMVTSAVTVFLFIIISDLSLNHNMNVMADSLRLDREQISLINAGNGRTTKPDQLSLIMADRGRLNVDRLVPRSTSDNRRYTERFPFGNIRETNRINKNERSQDRLLLNNRRTINDNHHVQLDHSTKVDERRTDERRRTNLNKQSEHLIRTMMETTDGRQTNNNRHGMIRDALQQQTRQNRRITSANVSSERQYRNRQTETTDTTRQLLNHERRSTRQPQNDNNNRLRMMMMVRSRERRSTRYLFDDDNVGNNNNDLINFNNLNLSVQIISVVILMSLIYKNQLKNNCKLSLNSFVSSIKEKVF